MSKQSTLRKYGKQQKKPKCDRLFAELPQSPLRTRQKIGLAIQAIEDKDDGDAGGDNALAKLTQKLSEIQIQDENDVPVTRSAEVSPMRRPWQSTTVSKSPIAEGVGKKEKTFRTLASPQVKEQVDAVDENGLLSPPETDEDEDTSAEERVLSWPEVCPPGDKIVKIAEASYAEVYRVTNERGTSIIKVIRMESPIKAQTKAQQKAGLVDEEPHSEADLRGELKISEWLADVPGFVVYKQRYIVQGKACRELLETHQTFHKKLKRQDPDRLQFYPSPSRYLDDTRFLVVELGDAGIALEDFELATADQLWDIFFHVAIALARAEVRVEFEHRDLHEGNLCIRSIGEPVPKGERNPGHFGHSGLDITILDYGLSRAYLDNDPEESEPVAYDLERDLSLFTSDHALQCKVYRQMRSFLLRGDRVCLPSKSHKKANEVGIDGDPIRWKQYEPYTNVLWLAYIYQWMTGNNFGGPKVELNAFRRVTKEFWKYLDPEADPDTPAFESASDIVRFAVESGWIEEDQLMGDGRDGVEKSILSILTTDDRCEGHESESFAERSLRRSPRRPRRSAAG